MTITAQSEAATAPAEQHRARDAIIVAEDICKRFGDVEAIKHINLTVTKGTVLGLLGPNGAGKTTFVRILTALLRPDCGRAHIAGYDVVHDAMDLRRVIGLAGQYSAVDDNLSGRENLVMVGELYHLGTRQARQRADELLEQFDLTAAANRPSKTYSGGMRRRLDLAASLVASPQVLFLDEPTTGLDPRSRLGLWEVLKTLVSGGTTLLLTTQYLDEADELADTIAVIDHGTIIARGSADELKSQIGGDVLDVQVVDPARAQDAADAIAGLKVGEPHIESDEGHVTVRTSDSSHLLANTVRVLDSADIEIATIALRRPSLDEVFLALTGHETDPATGGNQQ